MCLKICLPNSIFSEIRGVTEQYLEWDPGDYPTVFGMPVSQIYIFSQLSRFLSLKVLYTIVMFNRMIFMKNESNFVHSLVPFLIDHH